MSVTKERAMKPKITEEDVGDAIMAAFLETGADVTIAEIAARMCCSESTVRGTMKGGFAPAGTQAEEVVRPRMSKSYRWQEEGTFRVTVYGPTRECLREALLIERTAHAAIASGTQP